MKIWNNQDEWTEDILDDELFEEYGSHVIRFKDRLGLYWYPHEVDQLESWEIKDLELLPFWDEIPTAR